MDELRDNCGPLFRKRMELEVTNTAKGSEAAIVLLPSESYISRTPRLSQI